MIAVRWCLIRHPDLADAAPAPVAEEAFADYYEPRGWARISGWTDDPHTPADVWPRHEDDPEPVDEADDKQTPAPKKAAAKQDKES